MLLVKNQYYDLYLECQRHLYSGPCYFVLGIAFGFCPGLVRGSKLLNEVLLKYWKKGTASSGNPGMDERTTHFWGECGLKVVTNWGADIWKSDCDSDM